MISVFWKLQCATKQATQKADTVKRRDKSSSPFILFLFLQLLIGWVQLQTPAQGDLPSSHLHLKKKKKPTVEVENWSFSWMALASVALCMPHVKVRDLSNLSDWPINRLNDTKTGSLIRMERNHWQIHVKITEKEKKCSSVFPLHLH